MVKQPPKRPTKQAPKPAPPGLGKIGSAGYIKNIAAMELMFRAGKDTLEVIGQHFGLSKGRVSQIAKEQGWERDLAKQITARAQAKVTAHVASNGTASAAAAVGVEEVVEANAEVLAKIVLAQRRDAVAAREVVNGLMAELAEVNAAARDSKTGKKTDPKAMDLPSRVDVSRKLVETLKTAVMLERVVHGIADDTPIDPPKSGSNAPTNVTVKLNFEDVRKKMGVA